MNYFHAIIVGAGPSGITIAQKLSEKGKKVLIIEKRSHIGGNCYDYMDENGILIHKYGPHLFHTSFEDVWLYLNRFTEFTIYQHKVLGYVDGNLIPIPFNLNSVYKSFPLDYAQLLEKTLLDYFEYGEKVSIIELREKASQENNKQLQFIADYIFEKVFKNYTIKQWQIKPEKIDQNVLKRVPIMINKDDRYFPHHKYQGMPKNGYTKMFEKMIDSSYISIMLNTNYKDIIKELNYENLIVTGPIDEYFDYRYGKLEYKKTDYRFDVLETQIYQSVTTVNYPNDNEFTRITEMKHMYPESIGFKSQKTIICKEYPGVGFVDAYPVETQDNVTIFQKYKNDADKLQNVHFLGRLANYKYQDMDITFKNALDFNF